MIIIIVIRCSLYNSCLVSIFTLDSINLALAHVVQIFDCTARALYSTAGCFRIEAHTNIYIKICRIDFTKIPYQLKSNYVAVR